MKPANKKRASGGNELREQRERLQLALAATGLGTWEMDLVNNRRIWSGQTRWLHGLERNGAKDEPVLLTDQLMHPEDRERLRGLHEELRAGRDTYEFVYRTTRNGGERWIEARGTVLERTKEGPTKIVGVCADVTEKKKVEDVKRRDDERLIQAERHLRLATDAAGMFAWDVDVNAGTISWAPNAALLIGCRPDELGSTPNDATFFVAPEDRQRVKDIFETAILSGAEQVSAEFESNAGDGTRHYWKAFASFVRDGNGKVRHIAGITQDVGERKHWEAHQRLMTRELTHRVKNSFAVLLAILRSSLASSASPEAFTTAFAGRLHSLAAAQDILTDSDWREAELGALARHLLSYYADGESDRIVFSGPPADLGPEYVAPFALLLNELATNALKYGALAVPLGRIELTWRVERTERNRRKLNMTWREVGGPPVRPPRRRGFGSKLIEEGIPGAKVVTDFRRDGVVCCLELEFA